MNKNAIKITWEDFPEGAVDKKLPSNAGGAGSISGQGTKSPYTAWYGQQIK